MIKDEQADPCLRTVEFILQDLLPSEYKLEINMSLRILSLLSTNFTSVLAQEQFTKNELSILLALLTLHPHYTPYEILLASLTLLSPTDCRKRLLTARQLGPVMLKRELKPVYRALSSLRNKLHTVCPSLKICLIRDMGYAITSSPN